MTIQSLDPRIQRAQIPADPETPFAPLEDLDQLETYEVFHQERRGEHPTHVGSLHAPNPDVALLFAKEQYARRSRCVGLWVVKTADVFAIGVEDADIFATTPEKNYREASGYRVGTRLTAFKRKNIADNV